MIKYLKDGVKVRVMEKIGGNRFIIKKCYSYDDDEFGQCEIITDEETVVHGAEIFDTPPVEFLAKEIKKLENIKTNLSRQIKEIEEDKRKKQIEKEELFKKFEKYEQLEYIEQFLDGKLTHYVVDDRYGGFEIIEIEKAMCDCDRWQPKLLALYGNKDRTLEWKLHQYSDTSGSSKLAYPVTSYEKAIEKLTEIMHKYLGQEKIEDWKLIGIAKCAKKYQIELPKERLKEVEEIREKQRKKEIKGREAELAAIKKELERLKEVEK